MLSRKEYISGLDLDNEMSSGPQILLTPLMFSSPSTLFNMLINELNTLDNRYENNENGFIDCIIDNNFKAITFIFKNVNLDQHIKNKKLLMDFILFINKIQLDFFKTNKKMVINLLTLVMDR